MGPATPTPGLFKRIVTWKFVIKHLSTIGLPSTVPDELIRRTSDPRVCVLTAESGVVALSLPVRGDVVGGRV